MIMMINGMVLHVTGGNPSYSQYMQYNMYKGHLPNFRLTFF